MNVVVDIVGEVKVDDAQHVGDVESTRSHISGHHHGTPTAAEHGQCMLALALGSIT